MASYRMRLHCQLLHAVLLTFMHYTLCAAFIERFQCHQLLRFDPFNTPVSRGNSLLHFPTYMVSELHIPGYSQTKLPFILPDEEASVITLSTTEQSIIPTKGYTPYEDHYLIHETARPILTVQECEQIMNEVEYVASNNIVPWTTNRHGNYPTTDIPIVELQQTLHNFQRILQQRIYPNLRHQFGSFLPAPDKLRVADGFVVKYDANNGQKELRPHRDGSVLSFNIALNPSHQYNGGGTWFASPTCSSTKDTLNSNIMENSGTVIQLEQGHMVSHASALLHGGHPITSGIRYILVAFVIVEDYDSWSMRFYNQVRNL
jgi:hypothetical protein